MRLKVLLPDGTIKKFPNESRRTVTDGKLAVVGKDGKELQSFPKGSWTAVGRMRVATEASDEE